MSKQVIVETTIKVTRVLRECPNDFKVDKASTEKDALRIVKPYEFDNVTADVKVFELEEKK